MCVTNDGAEMVFEQAIAVGGMPTGVVVGDGAVWVINQADQTLARIDPATGTVEATKATLGTPTGIALGESAVWMTNGFGSQTGGSQVVRVDPADNRVERAFDSPNAQAIAVAFGSIWLADPAGDRVIRYDPVTYEAVSEIAFDPGSSPSFLAVGDGWASGIWVANELAGTVAWIDPDSDAFTTFGVDSPTAVAATDEAVWVTSNANDSLTRIDPSSGITVATFTLQGQGIPDGPSAVVVAPSGVWVSSNLDPVVVRIDPATNTVVDRLPVRGITDALAVDEGGDVWVTVHRP